MTGGDRFLIYGATGYTGRLIAHLAKEKGLSPVLAGRDRADVEKLAGDLGFDFTVFRLDDADAVDRALGHVKAVLHAAGPFAQTSAPMVDACLRQKRHYVDLTGEIDVIEACAARGPAAADTGVMLLPAAGFDVVPGDCLARHVAGRVDTPVHLTLALGGMRSVSRGTAKTAAQALGRKVRARRGGRLVDLPRVSERAFDFGSGPRPARGVGAAEVAAAYYSTGIPDIDVYLEMTPALKRVARIPPLFGPLLRSGPAQEMIRRRLDKMAVGPSDAERAARSAVIVAEVTDSARNSAVSRLLTPDPYSFTAQAALQVVQRVLDGAYKVGFQTPAMVYGADFVLELEDVTREDV